jgi:hypothetical protein
MAHHEANSGSEQVQETPRWRDLRQIEFVYGKNTVFDDELHYTDAIDIDDNDSTAMTFNMSKQFRTAFDADDADEIEKWLQAGLRVDIEWQYQHSIRVSYTAYEQQKMRIFNLFLQKGCDVNGGNPIKNASNLLTCAIRKMDTVVVETLLNRGATFQCSCSASYEWLLRNGYAILWQMNKEAIVSWIAQNKFADRFAMLEKDYMKLFFGE